MEISELEFEIIEQNIYGRCHTGFGMEISPSENTVVIRTPHEVNEAEQEIIIEAIEDEIEFADEVYFEFVTEEK